MEKQSPIKGIRGWLIIVAIGVVITPFRTAISLFPLIQLGFDEQVWSAVTNKTSAFYNPYWTPAYIIEVAFNSVLFAVGLWLIWLFFRTSQLFPKVFSWLLLACVAYIPVEIFTAIALLGRDDGLDAQFIKEVFGTLISAAIWVPYMQKSERVRNTFVRG